MRSQLKRVDGEVTALGERIKALDENLEKSAEYIKTATAALAEAVAMNISETENDNNHSEENNNPLSQFDAQMAILEGRLLQAKYLASKASSQSINLSNSAEENSSNSTIENNNIVTTTSRSSFSERCSSSDVDSGRVSDTDTGTTSSTNSSNHIGEDLSQSPERFLQSSKKSQRRELMSNDGHREEATQIESSHLLSDNHSMILLDQLPICY